MKASHNKKKVCLLFFKKIVDLFKKFVGFFEKNTANTFLKSIDGDSLKVFLFTRGCRDINVFHLSDVIFDSSLIATLSQKSAATIGYYYGINYSDMFVKTKNVSFCLTEESSGKFSNQILSLARGNQINFSSKSALGQIKCHKMHPVEIITNEVILNQFQPIQACYIGMQLGMRASLKNEIKN